MPSVSSINSMLLLLLTAVIFCTSCGDNAKQPAAARRHTPPPEEGTNIEGLLSEPSTDSTHKLSAKVKGKLTAPYMLRFQRTDSPYEEFPRSLHVDFYNDSMAIESQMDALYGKYLQNQDKVYLRDTVIVKNVLKGDTLHCKYLWWDKRTEQFYTDDSVAIYTKDKILF